MQNTKILIVDDDRNICELIKLCLEKEGFETRICTDGLEAIEVFKTYLPNIVLLDIMMPKVDGFQVCREIRKSSNVPIIMLTAKSDTFDTVLGLELGADDYMTKPFESKELIARIKAVLRRFEPKVEDSVTEVTFPNLHINMTNYELTLSGETIDIPPRELELLFFLCVHKNQVFTREQLLEQVWGFNYCGESRTVDVHVKRLREKLEGHEDNWQLKTKHRVGYVFEVK